MNLAQQLWAVGNYRSSESINIDLNDEFDFHLACLTDELVRSGMAAETARAEALKRFGCRERIQTDCRQIQLGWTERWIRLSLIAMLAALLLIVYLAYWLFALRSQNLELLAQLQCPPAVGTATAPTLAAAATASPTAVVDKNLTGRIIGGDGEPIARAKILLIHKSWPNNRFSQAAFSTQSDDEGKYLFENQYTDRMQNAFLVTVLADGYALSSHYVVFKSGQQAKPMDFKLAQAPNKTFVVKDEKGRALAHTKLYVLGRTTSDKQEHLIYAQSAAQTAIETNEAGEAVLAYFHAGDTAKLGVQVFGDLIELEVLIGEEETYPVIIKKQETSANAVDRWLPEPVDNSPEQVNWLKQNAVVFRSIDPFDDDFSDLAPLEELIGDARIVQLGEESHGDGACFETKTRLIKFLHQELDFDVLAFESGLYDCRKAWQAFADCKPADEAAEQGVFGIWTGSKQTAALWQYLSEQAQSERPLQLVGFDCQFTGAASFKDLVHDLRELASRVSLEVDQARWASLESMLASLLNPEQPTGSAADLVELLTELKTALDQTQASSQFPAPEKAFWSQQLVSMKDHCGRIWGESHLEESAVAARDKQMAENFLWLAGKAHPDQKIIVWGASFHLARNLTQVEVPDGSADYSKLVQMGQRVHEALGDQIFTVGFTAYDGSAGAFFRPPFDIGPAPKGTFESLCHAADLQNALIPLNAELTGGDWLDEKIFARPLGYTWMRSSWTKNFDAMIFNHTMTPSTL